MTSVDDVMLRLFVMQKIKSNCDDMRMMLTTLKRLSFHVRLRFEATFTPVTVRTRQRGSFSISLTVWKVWMTKFWKRWYVWRTLIFGIEELRRRRVFQLDITPVHHNVIVKSLVGRGRNA